MRVRGLNRALAVVAIVALAACSKTSEQAETSAARAVTFNEIAPILFDNCASCHRPIEDAPQAAATSDLASPKPLAEAGSADDPICVAGAPFSVLDYEAVRRYARAIASAVERRTMPP